MLKASSFGPSAIARMVIRRPSIKNYIENKLRFLGQYFNEESGLHYNRFRYYYPEYGRLGRGYTSEKEMDSEYIWRVSS